MTIEAAIGLVCVALVTTLLAGVLLVLGSYLQLTSAAREGARLLARGDEAGAVRVQVDRICSGAIMEVGGDSTSYTVTLHRRVGGPGLLARVIGVDIAAVATSYREQDLP